MPLKRTSSSISHSLNDLSNPSPTPSTRNPLQAVTNTANSTKIASGKAFLVTEGIGRSENKEKQIKPKIANTADAEPTGAKARALMKEFEKKMEISRAANRDGQFHPDSSHIYLKNTIAYQAGFVALTKSANEPNK